MKPINAQYNVAEGGGLTDRVSTWQRRRMYARFLAMGVQADDTLLDVGVTSDRDQLASNYLEAWHPRKDTITACGIDDAAFLEEVYPGMRFLQADGTDLPFADASFDWVHSSAVLEHVGSAERQARFIAELFRVCRKGLFVTTPNRWFPIEFHTVLPLVHWLPKPAFRGLLRSLGQEALAQEAHLNLLGRADLAAACRTAGLHDWRIDGVRLGGWTSNLLLLATPRGRGRDARGPAARPGGTRAPGAARAVFRAGGRIHLAAADRPAGRCEPRRCVVLVACGIDGRGPLDGRLRPHDTGEGHGLSAVPRPGAFQRPVGRHGAGAPACRGLPAAGRRRASPVAPAVAGVRDGARHAMASGGVRMDAAHARPGRRATGDVRHGRPAAVPARTEGGASRLALGRVRRTGAGVDLDHARGHGLDGAGTAAAVPAAPRRMARPRGTPSPARRRRPVPCRVRGLECTRGRDQPREVRHPRDRGDAWLGVRRCAVGAPARARRRGDAIRAGTAARARSGVRRESRLRAPAAAVRTRRRRRLAHAWLPGDGRDLRRHRRRLVHVGAPRRDRRHRRIRDRTARGGVLSRHRRRGGRRLRGWTAHVRRTRRGPAAAGGRDAVALVPPRALGMARLLTWQGIGDGQTSSFGDPAALQAMWTFVNAPELPDDAAALAGFGLPSTAASPMALRWMKYWIGLGYGFVLPWLWLAGLAAFALASIDAVRRRRLDPLLVLASAAWSLLFARGLMMVLVDMTSFPAIKVHYLQPAYGMLVIAAFASLALLRPAPGDAARPSAARSTAAPA